MVDPAGALAPDLSTRIPAYWEHHDPTLLPSADLCLSDLLRRAAEEVPDREAVVFLPFEAPPQRWTYRQLADDVDVVTRALLAAGVRRGCVVSLYAGNCPHFVMLQLAASRIGVALVAINPIYTADEVRDAVQRSRAEVCFVDHASVHTEGEELLEAMRDIATLRSVVGIGAHEAHDPAGPRWSDFLGSAKSIDTATLEEAEAVSSGSDTGQIQLTSGTTGRPKAVRLRDSALANGGRMVAARADIGDGCRYLHAMPFCHVGGTVSAMAATLAARGTQLFQTSFRPSRMAAAMEEEQVSVVLAVPTMMISLSVEAQKHGYAFRALRRFVTGGSMVSEPIAKWWKDTYDAGISITYGMTEVAGTAVQTSPTDPHNRLLTSVGRPLPGVEIEVVEVGGDRRLIMEEEGEVRFRSWGLMEGYEGDEDATRAVVNPDGWMRSGDLGRLAPDGFLTVTGRAKDMIIRGGENLSPSSIEDAIRQHVPGVIDVAVVGVPDNYYGETVAAFVQVKEGAEMTLAMMKSRLENKIARFKIPAHLHLVNSFPTTATGKIQKFELRRSLE